MVRHTISHADELYFGQAQYNPANGSKRGIPITPLTVVDLGAPVVADPDRILNDADATDSAQVHTTFLAQPDVPRNLTATGTAGSNHVVTITGTDVYGEVIVEQLTLNGTNVISGKKAFNTVTQVAVAAGAAGDTFDLGVGSAIGLPYRVDEAGLVMAFFDSTLDLTTSAVLGTFVAAVTAVATATTGDVRGTYTPVGTLDGTANLRALIKVADPTSKVGAYGVDQYGG